ncbi:MAG: hypothetical protein KGZ30_02075 [Anaplasmataceae bacterium]|nr:hypothetical protein [Anaplasmataceae bacterium]
MILVTHGIIGAAAGSFFSFNPILAFIAGFVSHFAADTIPHWHYHLKSFVKNKYALKRDIVFSRNSGIDIIKLGLDGLSSIILPVLFFWPVLPFSLDIILLGAIGGILPDALQFVYMKTKKEPLTTLQRFHLGIHSRIRLDDKPLIGITSQALIALITVCLTYWLLGT